MISRDGTCSHRKKSSDWYGSREYGHRKEASVDKIEDRVFPNRISGLKRRLLILTCSPAACYLETNHNVRRYRSWLDGTMVNKMGWGWGWDGMT